MKTAICLLLLVASMSTTTAMADAGLTPAFEAMETRNYDDAIRKLRALPGDNRDVLFHLARVQYMDGRYEAASDTLVDLHERYPRDADAWYLSGLVSLALVAEVSIFRKVGMASKSLQAWENAVEIDPSHINARYGIFAFYANAPGIAGGDLARAKSMKGDLAAANAGFGAMAEGLLQSKDGNVAEAEAAYLEAAALLDRAGPHFALAQFYLETEQYDKVAAEIDQFIQKEKRWWDPDITMAHLIRAQASAALGNEAAARTELETALTMNPNDRVRDLLDETLRSLN